MVVRTNPLKAPAAAPSVKPAESSRPVAKPAAAITPTAAPATPASTFSGPAAPASSQLTPPEKRASVLPDKKTILDGLKDPNYFGEKDSIAPFRLDAGTAPAARSALDTLSGKGAGKAFFDGTLGRLDTARFVNRTSRNDADFRYAYGEQAFRAWASADAALKAIPEGQLADKLDLALLQQVSKATFTRGEEPLMERLGHAFRTLRGEKLEGGQLRDYTTQTTPHDGLPADQVKNLQALGLTYQALPAGKAVIKYPPADVMRAGLDKLLADTRAALKDPSSDIVAVASHFAQQFIALHPFQDGNGRIGRLMMDRILAERGVPPPIMADTGTDVSLSGAQYQDEVARGIARTIAQVNSAARSYAPADSPLKYSLEVFKARGINVAAATDVSPVMINGVKYAQGPDGFVYDQAGRPHLLDSAGVLQPLSQINFYFAMRRVSQATDPKAALAALTGKTSETFAAWSASPQSLAQAKVASDQPAIDADNHYRPLLAPGGNEAFVALFNPALSTPEVLFGFPAATSHSTFAMSRYEQLDHEMYLVEDAARRAGDGASVKTLQGFRAQLFDQARAFLATFKDPTRVSAENPNGFKFRYEQLQYQTSPLRFDSFQKASKEAGDRMLVYRGDAGSIRYTGILPDGKPTNSDALAVSKVRAERGGTLNIFGDLAKVAGASGGTGYQSTTTDLALLASASGFAGKTDRVKLNIGALPDWVEKAAKERLKPGETLSVDSLRDVAMEVIKGRDIPPGNLEISGIEPERMDTLLEKLGPSVIAADKLPLLRTRIAEARTKADEAGPLKRLFSALSDRPVLVDVSDLVPAANADYAVSSIQDRIAEQRDLVTIRRDPNDENALQVTSYRRAFVVEVDRSAGLPGPGTLGVGQFHREQEITLLDTGLDSTGPRRIKQAFTVEELTKEFPVTTPAPAPAPAAPAAPAPA